MAVIGFVSEKGGVGKTTACYHIAVGLRRFHRKRVLVIDADYQRGGITGRFFPDLIEGFREGTLPDETLYNKFQKLYSASELDKNVSVRHAPYEAVDVIVADKRLSDVTTDKLPSTNNIRDNNTLLLRHLQVIEFVISEMRSDYDYILIDSHPEISPILRCIIYAADYCVSPVKLDLQSSIGVPTIISEISLVNEDVALMKATIARDLEYVDTRFSGAIGMMARDYGGMPKQSEQEEIRRLSRAGAVFRNYVTEGDGLRIAAQNRMPVYDMAGANAAKQSAQFAALTQEILTKCP